MRAFYGPTIRTIRLDKGFSQKEIYTGIVSKTYAIQFEKGEHDFTVQKFEDILARLQIDYEELLYIYNDYQLNNISHLQREFIDAINADNTHNLETYQKKMSEEKSDEGKLTHALMIIWLTNNKNPNGKIPEYPLESVHVISQHLLSKETWMLNEIALFANTISIFEYKQMLHFLKQATKNLLKYRHIRIFELLFSGLLINALDFILEQRDWPEMKHYVAVLEKESTDQSQIFARIIYKFYQEILLIVEGDSVNGHHQVTLMIQIMKTVDQEKIAVAMQHSFNHFLKNQQ